MSADSERVSGRSGGESESAGRYDKGRDIRRGLIVQARQDSNLQPPVLEFGALRPFWSRLVLPVPT